MKNKLLTSAGALVVIAGLGHFYAKPLLAQVRAALVQVVNTAAAPAITQDVAGLASSAVALLCQEFNHGICISEPGFTSFTVPAGQSLVVNAVDFFPSSTIYTFYCGVGGTQYYEWSASAAQSLHLVYPSGLVLPGGCTPVVFGGSTSASVQLTGYLTSN